MKKFTKCELCDAEIPDKKCVFAVHKVVVDDEEYYFCCKRHADEFERKRRKQR